MDRFKSSVIAVILGFALTWASVWITGIGAAVAVPAELLKPIAKVSVLLAFTLVDLFTIAIPLAAVFLVVAALASKLMNKNPDALFYLLLLAPQLLFQLYFLLQPHQQMVHVAVTTLPRYILLAVCFYFLVRRSAHAND